MLTFPKDFVWGSSTSGPQTEGRVPGDGKGDNLWDYWYKVEPNRYYNEIGPEQTSTFYEHWEQDIDLLAEPFELLSSGHGFSHKAEAKLILKEWLSTDRSLKPLRLRESAF